MIVLISDYPYSLPSKFILPTLVIVVAVIVRRPGKYLVIQIAEMVLIVVILEVNFFINLWHIRTIAIPVSVNAYTTYTAQ